MKHFALLDDFAPDFREKRPPYRAAHLALANAVAARGDIVLAGAFAEDPPGGMLLFKSESAAVAEDFAFADPYVLNGIVTTWRVREWVTVAGREALTPVT